MIEIGSDLDGGGQLTVKSGLRVQTGTHRLAPREKLHKCCVGWRKIGTCGIPGRPKPSPACLAPLQGESMQSAGTALHISVFNSDQAPLLAAGEQQNS